MKTHKHPDRTVAAAGVMKRRRTLCSQAGFTLIELMVVVAVIGMLAAIAIPNFIKALDTARAKTCLKNQRLMTEAKAMAAMDHKWGSDTSFGSMGNQYQQILASYLKPGSELSQKLGGSGALRPICPLGHMVTWNGIGSDVTCHSGLPSHDP